MRHMATELYGAEYSDGTKRPAIAVLLAELLPGCFFAYEWKEL